MKKNLNLNLILEKLYLIALLMSLTVFLFACQQKREIHGPSYFNYDNDTYTLSWEQISSASGYVLVLNKQEIDVLDNNYNMESYEQMTYHAKVKAIFADGESIYSNVFTFVVEKPIVKLISSQEVLYDNQDVSFVFQLNGFLMESVDNKLTNQDYIMLDDTLTIKKSYIDHFITLFPDNTYLSLVTAFKRNEKEIKVFLLLIKLKQ